MHSLKKYCYILQELTSGKDDPQSRRPSISMSIQMLQTLRVESAEGDKKQKFSGTGKKIMRAHLGGLGKGRKKGLILRYKGT